MPGFRAWTRNFLTPKAAATHSLVQINIKTDGPGVELLAVLYVDLGGGFSKDRTIVLPSSPKDGALRAMIELLRLTWGLRSTRAKRQEDSN